MKITMLIILLSLVFSSQCLFAQAASESTLFLLEKTYNQQNLMNVFTLVDNNCKFVSSTRGYLDLVWWMNGNPKDRKDPHAMIRAKTEARMQFLGINSTRDIFKLKLSDLSEIRHDLQDTAIEVIATIQGGKCVTKPIIKLGPSGNYRKMSLARTLCEVETNMIGIPKGCRTLSLVGTDADTGEKIPNVIFKAR